MEVTPYADPITKKDRRELGKMLRVAFSLVRKKAIYFRTVARGIRAPQAFARNQTAIRQESGGGGRGASGFHYAGELANLSFVI
jgi:hypothetical protein